MEAAHDVRWEMLGDWMRGRLRSLHRTASDELRHHDFGDASADVGPLFASFERDLPRWPSVLEILGGDGVRTGAGSCLPGLADRPNSLPRAAASLLLTSLVRGWMSGPDVVRAWATKFLCIRLFDLVDDLMDESSAGPEAVNRAIGPVLAGLTAAEFDPAEIAEEIAVGPDEVPSSSLGEAVDLVTQIRTLLRTAPQFPRVAAALRSDIDGLAVGQAVSGWLQLPTADLGRARLLAEGLEAPSADVPWEYRYVKALTWTGTLTLVDLAYASRLPDGFDLRRHLDAWYYLDVVMGAMDHFVTRQQDLGRGIVNSVTLALVEHGVSDGPRTFFARPTMSEYERLFAGWAEYTRRALCLHPPCAGDSVTPYRRIATITPIVFFHQHFSEQRDSLHAYLRVLSAVMRTTAGSSGANGDPWVAPLVTIPPRTRSTGLPRGRIGSSLLARLRPGPGECLRTPRGTSRTSPAWASSRSGGEPIDGL